MLQEEQANDWWTPGAVDGSGESNEEDLLLDGGAFEVSHVCNSVDLHSSPYHAVFQNRFLTKQKFKDLKEPILLITPKQATQGLLYRSNLKPKTDFKGALVFVRLPGCILWLSMIYLYQYTDIKM